jgi:uncharacterized small protein (DUF1192 family)
LEYTWLTRHGREAINMSEVEMPMEEDAHPVKRRRLEPLLLDSLGIEELHLYVQELKAEISRVEADIDRKSAHRSAADAFFKPS